MAIKPSLGASVVAASVNAIFFFSDMKPKNYKDNEKIDIFVGQLWSDSSSLPFDFYKLHWCPSTAGHEYDPATVGVALRDIELSESPWQFKMGVDMNPSILCTKNYKQNEADQFIDFIKEGYRYNLYLDGLPAAVYERNQSTGELKIHYSEGIPIGYFDETLAKYVIYNHLHMEVQFNRPNGGSGKQIVGFEVEPRSIASDGGPLTWGF